MDVDGVYAELPPILADAVAVERIFINLLTNARDAIEETGRGEGTIRISAHSEREFVICEVADDGLGIAQEILPRIFDPYFTTKTSGTGLGLAIAHRIITEHNGRMEVASEPGKGTTFTINLPLSG